MVGAIAAVGFAASPAEAATKTFSCATGSTAYDDKGYLYTYYSASGTSSWLVTGVDYRIFMGQGIRYGNHSDVYYTDNAFAPSKNFSTGNGKSDGTLGTLTTADYLRPRNTINVVNFKFTFDESLSGDPSCTGSSKF
ncbi:hypothetical protein QRX50_28645 [Amycolatopsis carbonis]|uniref:Uncharacterized protein n=1 Tax=Amycolatopsis carbonis TaxID=715471 RepID=A0A9Y2MRH5_9PSEU|nr:hypothetical protein [Amycolatopsis sp. 2-15]WIX75476.1 hypothetical protein QRX50_28645 [Amycolatopsis sp. 2-15]